MYRGVSQTDGATEHGQLILMVHTEVPSSTLNRNFDQVNAIFITKPIHNTAYITLQEPINTAS